MVTKTQEPYETLPFDTSSRMHCKQMDMTFNTTSVKAGW